MADRNLSFRVAATDDASTTFSKIAQASKREMGKVQKDLDDTASRGKQMAQVLESMAEELDDEFRKTEQAAERLGSALGPELAAKVNPEQIIGDFRRAGLTFEEIEADAEELAAAIKKIDDVSERAGATTKRAFDDLDGSMKKLGDTTDNTRSVTANFTGNLASEIPGISGAMGPLNMAIGQFGEYAAEGNIRLRNLIAAGAGMGVVSAAFIGITGAMKRAEESKAFDKERVNEFRKALMDSGDAAGVLRSELEETGKVLVELPGAFDAFGSVDIAPMLDALGLTVDQFSSLAGRSEEQIRAWGDEMIAAGANAEMVGPVVLGLIDTHSNLATAQEQAAITARVLGDATGASAEDMDAAAVAGDRYRAALEELNDAQDAALGNNISLAEAMLNTADALDEYTATMENAEASDREKQQAGLDLISTMVQEAEAAGRSAEDQARAAGRSATAVQEGNQAQIDSLTRLAQNLEPGSYLRNQIEGHIRALDDIPRTISTQVLVNTNYGQGTTPLGGTQPRARGGPVTAGDGYIVGEEGPEFFMPTASGTIIPAAETAAALNGASAAVVLQFGDIHIHAQRIDERSGPELINALEVEVRRSGSNMLRRLVGL